MKHIIDKDSIPYWDYDRKHNVYRVEFILGCNKRQTSYLQVNEVFPIRNRLDVVSNKNVILPRDKFVVENTRKGYVISKGADESDSVLVFVGASCGLSGVDFLPVDDRVRVLLKAPAGNVYGYRVEVAAILQKGGRLEFHDRCRSKNYVIVYEWDGINLLLDTLHYKEWICLREDVRTI